MAADSANFAMVHLVTNVGDGSPGIPQAGAPLAWSGEAEPSAKF